VQLADRFFLPRTLGVYRNEKSRRIKAAIVGSAEKQERAFRFFETVTSNVGMDIRIFFQEEIALEWLRTVADEGAGSISQLSLRRQAGPSSHRSRRGPVARAGEAGG
jgi:hypothetical protein